MNDVLKRTQSHVSGMFIARTLSEFRIKFKEIYPEDRMIQTFTAVGPMQSYVGMLVELGMITINTRQTDLDLCKLSETKLTRIIRIILE